MEDQETDELEELENIEVSKEDEILAEQVPDEVSLFFFYYSNALIIMLLTLLCSLYLSVNISVLSYSLACIILIVVILLFHLL